MVIEMVFRNFKWVVLIDAFSFQRFINTELYARVSVAVLFYKLANLAEVVGLANASEDCQAALDSGKMFLLELLDLVVFRSVPVWKH